MAAIVALLVFVAGLASLVPAFRSARNSPALSLRYEFSGGPGFLLAPFDGVE